MFKLLKKFGLSDEELVVNCTKVIIRPLLEYSDVAWHSSITDHQSHVLEQLQWRAKPACSCRVILGQALFLGWGSWGLRLAASNFWRIKGKIIVAGLPKKGFTSRGWSRSIQKIFFLHPDYNFMAVTSAVRTNDPSCVVGPPAFRIALYLDHCSISRPRK